VGHHRADRPRLLNPGSPTDRDGSRCDVHDGDGADAGCPTCVLHARRRTLDLTTHHSADPWTAPARDPLRDSAGGPLSVLDAPADCAAVRSCCGFTGRQDDVRVWCWRGWRRPLRAIAYRAARQCRVAGPDRTPSGSVDVLAADLRALVPALGAAGRHRPSGHNSFGAVRALGRLHARVVSVAVLMSSGRQR
jgi:hypothetical protein